MYSSAPMPAVSPLTTSTYVPRGMAAFLDAVGRTINDLDLRLYHTLEAERPGKVISAFSQDGTENARAGYMYEPVAAMIRCRRTKYSWECIFLAANQDAIAAASALLIEPQDAVSFEATGDGVQTTYAVLSADVTARRRRRLRLWNTAAALLV